MLITRERLTTWRTDAGLAAGDEALARHIPALLAAINGPEFDGAVDETSSTVRARLAALLVISEADLVKVAALAVAAGRLVKL